VPYRPLLVLAPRARRAAGREAALPAVARGADSDSVRAHSPKITNGFSFRTVIDSGSIHDLVVFMRLQGKCHTRPPHAGPETAAESRFSMWGGPLDCRRGAYTRRSRRKV
jgi:hypothetical protein